MRLYDIIFRSTPKKYRSWIRNYLRYAGFKISPEKYVGLNIIYGLILSSIVFLILIFLKFPFKILLPSFITTFFIFQIVMHSILIVTSDRIAKFTNKILPDALRLISANIRSGLTPDKALLLAARPEFGPLKEQIMKSAKLTFSGEPIESALQEIPKNINSEPLKRSIDLLIEGMAHGGNLAHLLDGLANDIRQTEVLKREVRAFVMMYAIFIFLAAGIGAPLLYGISSYLVETMKEMGGMAPVQRSLSQGIKFMPFKGIKINEQFLMIYSFLALGITSVFGGMLIGLIQEGSEKGGLKYIPLLLALSIGIFFLSRTLVSGVFGVMVK